MGELGSMLTRRTVLRGLATTAVAMSATTLAGCATGPVRPRVAPRPNFLLVILDDLGRGEVGAYGQQVLRTPVLDALAAEGMRFDQAYATPTCAPTRCALLTGLHTGHARVKSNTDASRGLLPEDVTVAEVLRDAGYTTGLVGKWGLGPDNGDNPSHPNSQGFDYFFGYLNQGHAQDYWPTYLWRNERRVKYPENKHADTTYVGDLITQEALGFLDRLAPGERFFLTVAPTLPHAPNEIPSDKPYSNKRWPAGERNHAAQVTAADAQVGVVLDGLRARGLADDTLVLVISDNGPHSEGAHYGRVGSRRPHDAEFSTATGSCAARRARSTRAGSGSRCSLFLRRA